MAPMVTHVVLFRFDEPASAAEAKRLLEALPPLVPQIASLSVGLDVSGSETAYDLALVTTHDSPEALRGYVDHPEHQRVAAFIGAHRTERASVDFLS
jgi:hypothetical protein